MFINGGLSAAEISNVLSNFEASTAANFTVNSHAKI